MGAGVECSFASLAARESPDPELPLEDDEVQPWRLRKSVARKKPFPEDREPWTWLFGHREGTMEWMALRDVCSP